MANIRSGIYEIVHRDTGKRYVGSGVHLGRRFSKHRSKLAAGKHHSRILQNAWNAHGSGAFDFRILLFCSREMCIAYEQIAMDALRPEYNVLPRAGSCLGRKLSEEHKAKVGGANRGRYTPLSAESRAKISAANKGRPKPPRTIEHRTAISHSKRGTRIGPPSVATREKISAALVGRKLSQEHCEKLRLATLGKRQSPEHVAKAAAARTGKKRGPYNKRGERYG